MKQALGVPVDYAPPKNIRDNLSLPIGGTTEMKGNIVHHPLGVERLSQHLIDDPAQRGRMQGIVDKVATGFKHAVRFAARLCEIGYVLERLDRPDSVKASERGVGARERQCGRVGMHKRYLASDQRPEYLLRMKQIGAYEIDN